ncbi:MAG: PH domain-containing protein [Cellvibrionaceae bacterium]
MKFSSDENILHKIKPDAKLIYIWFFTKCITHGLATAFFPAFIWWGYATFSSLNKGIIIDEYGFFLTVGLFLFGAGSALSYLYVRALINSITFYVTDRRCIWTGGILRKVEHSASYIKITDVERSQNIAEQILKLSTINLFTPGTSSMGQGLGAKMRPIPELRFEGLLTSEEVAETINDGVRRYGSKQP